MKFPVLILLFATVVTGVKAQTETTPDAKPGVSTESLGDRLIDALPVADDGTFTSPEAVARGITEALIDDDWDRAVSATTIPLRCARVTFGATALDIGAVTPIASGDPSAPLSQFLAHIQNIQPLRQIQLTLAGEPNPAKMRRLEIDREAPDLKALAALKEVTLYKRPADLRILAVEIDSDLSEKTWKMMQKRRTVKELGADDAAYLQVTLTGVPHADDVTIDYIVLKIGTNWLVDTVFAP